MTISRKQAALLAVARKQLAMEEADYRSILRSVAGVDSGADLDRFTFDLVLRRFRELGFEPKLKKESFGPRRGMASPAQIELIRGLWRDFTGSNEETGFDTWLARTCKVSNLRFVNVKAAHQAINGLRVMVARKKAQSEAAPAA